MKSKSTLLLMELLIMVLVFALAAAMCLQLFGKAAMIAENSRHLDEAVRLAQSAASLLKASGGDTTALESLETGRYTIVYTPLGTTVPGLGMGRITVCVGEESLFALETGWQEVEE